MENVWIKSREKIKLKQKAIKIWKKYKHYPTIYQFDGEFMFAISDKIKRELNL